VRGTKAEKRRRPCSRLTRVSITCAAVVIVPAMLAVEGDVTFDDALTVPQVETALSNMEAELRSHWPEGP
jgi:hypothetical protein